MLFGYLFVLPAFNGAKPVCPSTNLVQLGLKVLKIGHFDNKIF